MIIIKWEVELCYRWWIEACQTNCGGVTMQEIDVKN